jgi:hypothetical protein
MSEVGLVPRNSLRLDQSVQPRMVPDHAATCLLVNGKSEMAGRRFVILRVASDKVSRS